MRSIAEKGTGSRVSGIINAVLSSSTFGFAPFFSVSLMAAGLSAAEVLTYRWGTATAALALFALIMRRPLSVTGKQFGKEIPRRYDSNSDIHHRSLSACRR